MSSFSVDVQDPRVLAPHTVAIVWDFWHQHDASPTGGRNRRGICPERPNSFQRGAISDRIKIRIHSKFPMGAMYRWHSYVKFAARNRASGIPSATPTMSAGVAGIQICAG